MRKREKNLSVEATQNVLENKTQKEKEYLFLVTFLYFPLRSRSYVVVLWLSI